MGDAFSVPFIFSWNKINRNPQRIANILNDHFASVSGDHRDFLKKTKSPASSFMFKPVTAREVELEICPSHLGATL